MSAFPTLKTGAVMQYPARRDITNPTQVLTFVDGSEQRYRERAGPLRRWVIQLDLLDENELRQIEEFFVAEQGRFANFAFTDPWDGTQYASCSLEADSVALEFQGEQRASASLVVRENV
jgi:hypothetical protein